MGATKCRVEFCCGQWSRRRSQRAVKTGQCWFRSTLVFLGKQSLEFAGDLIQVRNSLCQDSLSLCHFISQSLLGKAICSIILVDHFVVILRRASVFRQSSFVFTNQRCILFEFVWVGKRMAVVVFRILVNRNRMTSGSFEG